MALDYLFMIDQLIGAKTWSQNLEPKLGAETWSQTGYIWNFADKLISICFALAKFQFHSQGDKSAASQRSATITFGRCGVTENF